MEQQVNSKKTILTYGLLAGATAISVALIGYAMDKVLNPGAVLSIISFLVPLALIVLGIKKHKQLNNGFLGWEQAIKVGIGIALIWGLLTLSFQYILENVIAPELLIEKIENFRQELTERGNSEEVITEQVEKKRNLNPFLGNSMGLLFFIFIGFVVSAISGAIMKKTEED